MAAYRIRGKGVAYDNIASGSATGRERLVVTTYGNTSEVYGGGTRLAVGSSFATTDLHEKISIGETAPQRDNPATTPASS